MSWRITGSVAIKHWFPDFRNPGDIDVLSPVSLFSEKPSELAVDSHWYPVAEEIIKRNKDKVYLDPNMLYTIKVSHAAWNVKWEKTVSDISFLRRKSCYIEHYDILQDLIEHWKVVHGSKRVSMNTDNENFFKDAVNREIDHDALHEFVSYPDAPMHTRIRKDLNSPKCSKVLWDRLSTEEKFQTAFEEICVVALERYYTGCKQSDVRLAISKAHRNLVLTMTTGWFNLYLIENRDMLLYYHDWFVDVFKRKEKEWRKLKQEKEVSPEKHKT